MQVTINELKKVIKDETEFLFWLEKKDLQNNCIRLAKKKSLKNIKLCKTELKMIEENVMETVL